MNEHSFILLQCKVYCQQELRSKQLQLRLAALLAKGCSLLGLKSTVWLQPSWPAVFVRIAIASEFESKNHILKVAADGLITQAERDAGVRLTHRASTAAIRYRRYLKSKRAEDNARRIERRQMEDFERIENQNNEENDLEP